MSEEIKDEQVEEIKEQPDKKVEQSQFNRYRDAYLRQELAKLNVNEGAEMDAELAFIDERADETDSNLDEVFHDLKVRMRIDEKRKYIDPSPLGGGTGRPRPRNKEEVGKKAFERVKNKIRWG